jgi:cyclophilin family peptidyl-prolyl cis-trans isomerase
MSDAPSPRDAFDDTAWPEPGRWDPPPPGDSLLPPLAQLRDDERDTLPPLSDESASLAPDADRMVAEPLSSLRPPDPADLVELNVPLSNLAVPLAERPPPPAPLPDPPDGAGRAKSEAPVAGPSEPVESDPQAASPESPLPPKRKRSRLAIALIDAIGILLVILAIALVGKGIADRRNAKAKDAPLPTSVTPTSAETIAPPPTQPGRSIAGITPCPNSDGSESRATSFQKSPPLCIDATKRYRATILTNRGALNVTLDAASAPMTVNNFVVLARYHYFDNTVCPRIIPAYLFQCGDPTGKGTGGPGYAFPDELPAQGQYKVGSVAMATSLPDTNGSQFFIVLGSDGVALPAKYSLFGQVDPSQEAVLVALSAAGTEQGTPTKELVTIESVVILEG